MEKVGDTRYFTNGNVAIVEDVKIEITELPIGTWTQTYKENVLVSNNNFWKIFFQPNLEANENLIKFSVLFQRNH